MVNKLKKIQIFKNIKFIDELVLNSLIEEIVKINDINYLQHLIFIRLNTFPNYYFLTTEQAVKLSKVICQKENENDNCLTKVYHVMMPCIYDI